ncbi:MAG TPA: DUF397 domain-containing protein [Pseudonocardiaceae bacterium]
MDGEQLFDTAAVSDGWVRTSRCSPEGDNCVEVNRAVPGLVGVRDSTQPHTTVLVVAEPQWRSFLTAVRAGQIDSLTP